PTVTVEGDEPGTRACSFSIMTARGEVVLAASDRAGVVSAGPGVTVATSRRTRGFATERDGRIPCGMSCEDSGPATCGELTIGGRVTSGAAISGRMASGVGSAVAGAVRDSGETRGFRL